MIWGDKKLEMLVHNGLIQDTYDGAINPASINVRLGNSFLVPCVPEAGYCVKLGEEVRYQAFDISDIGSFEIGPGEFVLVNTMEWINVPANAAAFVQGRSSIGRAGLSVQNAGFVDPGFKGTITLELKNDAPYTIELVPGYPVAQLIYMDAKDVSHPYAGKYLNQRLATGSRMSLDDLALIFGMEA